MFAIHRETRPKDVEEEFYEMLEKEMLYFAIPLKDFLAVQLRMGIVDTRNRERLGGAFFNRAFFHGRFMEEKHGVEIGRQVLPDSTWYRYKKNYQSDRAAPVLKGPMVMAILGAMEQLDTKDLEKFIVEIIRDHTVALRAGITDLVYAEIRNKQGIWERAIPAIIVSTERFMFPWLLNLYRNREYADRGYCRGNSVMEQRTKVQMYAKLIQGKTRHEAIDNAQSIMRRDDQNSAYSHSSEVRFRQE